MNISKITSQISSGAQKLTRPLAKPMDNLATSVGKLVNKSDAAKKIVDAYELNGGDNQFFGLATIMVFAVLIPRILTALKRNPENKEATKDEINGILRRDVTTILTMLFALKSMNTLAGNLATKLTGIPMTSKPYQKLFNENAKTFGQKTLSAIGSLFNNAKDTLNPKGGSKLYSGKTIIDNYTGYRTVEQTQNFLRDTVDGNGGNSKKVFAKIQDSIVEKLESRINELEKSPKINDKLIRNDDAVELEFRKQQLGIFKDLTHEKFMSLKATEDNKGTLDKIEQGILDFFESKDNPIAKTANTVKVLLQTAALGIETFFLGFGLPSINQKLLEKKYLGEKPIGEQRGDTFSPVNDRHIKAQEIKLYSSFMK